MNPDDIIKAAPAIAKSAGALAAAIPFTAIVKRMLGPAADELAEMWRDQARMYRFISLFVDHEWLVVADSAEPFLN
jgi:hypothetical protein